MSIIPFTWAIDEFYNLKGEVIKYDKLISSPKTILFLWTSTCPYCMAELKFFNKNESFYGDVNIYYVNLGESTYRIERVIQYLGLKEPITKNIIRDPENILALRFSIIGLPTYLFFKNGIYFDMSNYLDTDLVNEVFKSEK